MFSTIDINHKDPHNRRASFKLPRKASSQESRRSAALDQQRKRREKQVDSTRNLDFFSSLTLTPPAEEPHPSPESPTGLATGQFPFSDNSTPTADLSQYAALLPPASAAKKFRPRKSSVSAGPKEPHRYANKLMYAELLEMRTDEAMNLDGMENGVEDALPTDLETAWVALAPVPVGKRCMAVTYVSNSPTGMQLPAVTALHSRLTGHLRMRFPSPLPPDTILDCILDERWQETGLLHALDVMRWRGTDMSQCEADFRLWFLRSRLAELQPSPPPNQLPFTQPNTILPVPYAAELTPAVLLLEVIPAAKAGRLVPLECPLSANVDEYGRALPAPVLSATGPKEVHIPSDGLLLHMAKSTYASGPTPLSCWVPSRVIEDECESRLDTLEKLVRARAARQAPPDGQEVQMDDF